MNIIEDGNMGVPPHLDIWVRTFYNNTVSLITEFIKLGRENNTLFYLDEEQTIESYSLNFKNNKDFDSTVFINNHINLKNLSIELNVFSVPKQHFSTDEWNAHYSDVRSELKGKTLHSAEIYFEFFLPEEILDISEEDLEDYLFKTNIKAYIMEYVSHELTHMYEFYIRKLNQSNNDWIERENNLIFNLLNDYLDTIGMKDISTSWNKLMYLIYMSTGFEINARIVQLFYRLDNSNKEVESYECFKDMVSNTLINREQLSMSSFNSIEWYDNFEYDEELAEQYLSTQDWITDDIKSTADVKDLIIKSLIKDLDYIIENVNTMDKSINRIPRQYIDKPILFFKHHEQRIKKYHKKLNEKIIRLYNKFI